MNITKVISAMTEYFSGDPKRVGHFLKVYAFSKTIGEAEKLSAENQEILLRQLYRDLMYRHQWMAAKCLILRLMMCPMI